MEGAAESTGAGSGELCGSGGACGEPGGCWSDHEKPEEQLRKLGSRAQCGAL